MADPIEEMGRVGTVVHREKVVARSLALICAVMVMFFGAAGTAYALGWHPETSLLVRLLTYVLPFFFAFIGLTRTVLRTVVTTREVHVGQGLWGERRIPIDSILKTEEVAGNKLVGGEELFVPAGSKCVAIEWRDETGKERKALIGSDDPAMLRARIEEVRTPRARIVTDAASSAEASMIEDEQVDPAARDARRL